MMAANRVSGKCRRGLSAGVGPARAHHLDFARALLYSETTIR
jgi:hypothetical protein